MLLGLGEAWCDSGKRQVSDAKSTVLESVYREVKLRKHGSQSHVRASHVCDHHSHSEMMERGEGMLKRESAAQAVVS